MDQNLNTDLTRYDDEIELWELMMILWKNKKTIIVTTAVFGLVALLLSVFIIKPVYETNLNISINMPEIMNTKYGDITMPIENNLEYINLFTEQTVMQKTSDDMGYEGVNLSSMRSKFTLPTKESNIANISVSANSPEEAVKLAQTAYQNYYEYLDIVLKTRALSTFENTFNVKIEQNQNQISNLGKSLESDRKTLQKVTDNINSSIKSSNKYGAIDYVALGEALGYAGASTTVIEKEQQINQLLEDNILYEKYLEEIEDMNIKIDAYNETGDETKLESKNFDFVAQNIQLLSNPRLPLSKSGPNTMMNLAIGLVLGLMAGVFYVFLRQYIVEHKNKNSY
ncbi:Wzz/FepE/Etk N-terminal domain-containing protein [Proteocatella sphenisci]|uniref:Wzz/FepE/Etk N-terminal domain-containing protein n=1 Tax=Proteocatella sphenisci TaxID=181070 RepID=UPI00048B662D|nr:Wzz/FepE/Etk N-terminal domain-containing protein [Proteocatella sphenisci]